VGRLQLTTEAEARPATCSSCSTCCVCRSGRCAHVMADWCTLHYTTLHAGSQLRAGAGTCASKERGSWSFAPLRAVVLDKLMPEISRVRGETAEIAGRLAPGLVADTKQRRRSQELKWHVVLAGVAERGRATSRT
jgi:hypothetical protein